MALLPHSFFKQGGYIPDTTTANLNGTVFIPSRPPASNDNYFEVELLRRLGVDPDRIPEGPCLARTG